MITTDKHQNRRKALEYGRDRKKMTDVEYEIEYEAGFKYNDEIIEFNSEVGSKLSLFQGLLWRDLHH